MIASAIRVLAGGQQFAELGNFKLENGGVIKDCRIGYRTFRDDQFGQIERRRLPNVGRRKNGTASFGT